mmetsp:Transcript_33366/g.86633  ORF Transcript_33366/g.86633 Transcript_33366/m.86633 type:complete len:353 (+) Transcript_33366:1425-2483(+)
MAHEQNCHQPTEQLHPVDEHSSASGSNLVLQVVHNAVKPQQANQAHQAQESRQLGNLGQFGHASCAPSGATTPLNEDAHHKAPWDRGEEVDSEPAREIALGDGSSTTHKSLAVLALCQLAAELRVLFVSRIEIQEDVSCKIRGSNPEPCILVCLFRCESHCVRQGHRIGYHNEKGRHIPQYPPKVRRINDGTRTQRAVRYVTEHRVAMPDPAIAAGAHHASHAVNNHRLRPLLLHCLIRPDDNVLLARRALSRRQRQIQIPGVRSDRIPITTAARKCVCLAAVHRHGRGPMVRPSGCGRRSFTILLAALAYPLREAWLRGPNIKRQAYRLRVSKPRCADAACAEVRASDHVP